MDNSVFFFVREGIELFKRHQYNRAYEQFARGQEALRQCSGENRRQKIDELNRSIFEINRICKKLEEQITNIRCINPNVDIMPLSKLITELRCEKAQCEVNKRLWARSREK